jgi:hypothetical protein
VALEELAERPEAGPQVAGGGEIDVVDEETVECDALLGEDRGCSPDNGAHAGGERGEGRRVPAVEQGRALVAGLDELRSGDGVAAGVLQRCDPGDSLQFAQLTGVER